MNKQQFKTDILLERFLWATIVFFKDICNTRSSNVLTMFPYLPEMFPLSVPLNLQSVHFLKSPGPGRGSVVDA